VPSVDYYFFAPIANSRGHFRSVRLAPPFKIQRWPKAKIVRLWRQLAWLPKFEIEVQIEGTECVPRGYEVGHVAVAQVSLPSTAEGGSWLRTHQHFDVLNKQLEDQLRLVSLYLCGHAELAASFWYTLEKDKPQMEHGGMNTLPIQDLAATVNQNNTPLVNAFLANTSFPLTPEYIQTALEHWEESLRSSKQHIEFLSLMMALETLFNVGAQDIRYRVSRSVAVLLGHDAEDADYIFNSVREAYDIRSKLVHTGKAKGLEKVWFWHLRHLVRDAILRLRQLALPKEEVSMRLTRLGFGQGLQVDG
jgi:hypothetical protein